ncbi:MAG: LacI family transcriptional regulator [Sphingobacteriaceae bacterium]|nr:MAG: LacI family transcriptional regulator [Sphingobacteriaceae bacterium]
MAPPPGLEEEITQLINEGFPVVLFDRNLPNVATDYVGVDNFFSTYNATKHLISQNKYQNIAFVTFTSAQTQLQQRMQGYKKAISEYKCKSYIKEIVYQPDNTLIIKPMLSFFKKNPNIDAVLFSTNHLGACGLRVIRDLGLSVPDDIAVVSFDDYEVFQLHSPAVTAIAQPIDKIADEIISMMVKRLRQPLPKIIQFEDIILPTQLLIRQSSNEDLPA